ncbi:MAG TPA: alpha/beta hydrolase [Terriglobales bacterium]|nr:alpha/beta hydrolase [Terriglobales bacterium]
MNGADPEDVARGNVARGNFADEFLPDLTQHTFNAGEAQLNYAEGPANGPPLVLLHGLGRRWQVFLPLISALSQRWHIFAPDLRGHGKSSRVARGYHGPQYSGDIANLLRERVGAPAVIFGHSLGGMLAMWLAAHHPELARALILGDNRIIVGQTHHPMYKALFSGLRDLARKGASIDDIADGIGKIELPRPGSDAASAEIITISQLPGNDKAYLTRWARCVQQADPDTYDMVLDGSSLEGWDGETVLRGINCPTLLLQGTKELGGLMSHADVELAKHILPHHAHVQFENLGHALFIQQPEPVLEAVTSFLESL